MRTKCISHPASAPLLVIHQWQQDICNGNTAAAALLSVFEYWHSIKLANLESGLADPDLLDLLQHHTEPELESYLLGIAKRKTIRASLSLLTDLGVVSIHKNPRTPTDQTRYFLFHPENAQSLADSWDEIYQAQAKINGKARKCCIPGNLYPAPIGKNADWGAMAETLGISPIGKNADWNRQKGILQSAKRNIAIGENDDCNRQIYLDPKITSKTSSEISLTEPESAQKPNPDLNQTADQPTSEITSHTAPTPAKAIAETRNQQTSDSGQIDSRLKPASQTLSAELAEHTAPTESQPEAPAPTYKLDDLGRIIWLKEDIANDFLSENKNSPDELAGLIVNTCPSSAEVTGIERLTKPPTNKSDWLDLYHEHKPTSWPIKSHLNLRDLQTIENYCLEIPGALSDQDRNSLGKQRLILALNMIRLEPDFIAEETATGRIFNARGFCGLFVRLNNELVIDAYADRALSLNLNPQAINQAFNHTDPVISSLMCSSATFRQLVCSLNSQSVGEAEKQRNRQSLTQIINSEKSKCSR